LDSVLLTGASGLTYEFKIFDPNAPVPPVGGVFVVSGRESGQPGARAEAVWLVGRTPDLSSTLAQVKRHARVTRSDGRWRYCVRFEGSSRAARSRIAKDLAAGFRTHRSI
jgi:hypothetical protein